MRVSVRTIFLLPIHGYSPTYDIVPFLIGFIVGLVVLISHSTLFMQSPTHGLGDSIRSFTVGYLHK